jgi:aromatic ring-cleaving dioxygenase
LSVLIHPNTGCEYEDHGKWTLWGGQPWQIDMDAMDTEDPFDNTPSW